MKSLMGKSIHGSPRLTDTVIFLYNPYQGKKQNKKRVSPLF
ncbi:hypothetical protein SORDD21_01860 [Streptococcus oralis]|uniref:Uncharacterized protein n=1 Tax=Streptococcus oralis TaxID=1303 RepID=A0A139PHN7_STROR|nr:hypothetical protein SORDD21_01860 [Streptococcus oralis]